MPFFDIQNIAFTVGGSSVCWLELIGFIVGLVAVYLAGRNNVLTFSLGILSCALSFWLFYQTHFYSMMLLQLIFAAINIYGIFKWSLPQKEINGATTSLKISRLSYRNFAFIIVATVLLGCLWGWLLLQLSYRFPIIDSPSFPYIEAVILAFEICGQVLLARKKIENWVVWIIDDIIGLTLWWVADIKLYAILYFLYLIIAIDALLKWRKQMKLEKLEI